jgi:hypothetical protein
LDYCKVVRVDRELVVTMAMVVVGPSEVVVQVGRGRLEVWGSGCLWKLWEEGRDI